MFCYFGGEGQGDRFSHVPLAGLELIGLLASFSQVLGLKLEGTMPSNFFFLHLETFSFSLLRDNGTSVVSESLSLQF